ncbi:MAG: peptide deformylase [Eubacteriaceae bacterium]|nr:peptide deformylase [Eubacteriaceae bacterium]
MAIRNIRNWKDPIFRKTSRVVESFDERLGELIDDMADTLQASRGLGCAAVHVGVLRRVVVLRASNGLIELVNPVIEAASEETHDIIESSIASSSPKCYVNRPVSVTVSGFDRHGHPVSLSGAGYLAAAICHELDHLDGILFTDKQVGKK